MPLRLQIALGPHFPGMAAERTLVTAPPAATWPFLYPLSIDWPVGPTAISVDAIHDAFVNQQRSGTRLVTTQPGYLMLSWDALAGDRDVIMLATAARESLEAHAPEILSGEGVFSETTIVTPTSTATGARGASGATGATGARDSSGATGAGGAEGASGAAATTIAPLGPAAVSLLIKAMRVSDAGDRLRLCVRALDLERTPGALLATASACMEVNDLEAAGRDLDEALQLAPDCAAAHFERGKLWLRLDDMERASEAFRASAERMPRFASAWSNLGATLGELDRTADALDAFTRALACDPSSVQTLNNIGVLRRELGQLAESEAAFSRVIERAPNLAFGYYNLGHTLFLQGRYQAALTAYLQGQKRDPARNPVQASRLAMCRLATGDPAGAVAELQRVAQSVTRDDKRQLLADTHAIAWALLTHRPDLPGWQQVNDWLTAELAR